MHLKNFAERKVLADQINFALDFGMEYYQGCFHFRPFFRLAIMLVTYKLYDIMVTNWWQNTIDDFSKLTWKPKKFVLDEQISEIHEKIEDIEYDLNLTAWKAEWEPIKWPWPWMG